MDEDIKKMGEAFRKKREERNLARKALSEKSNVSERRILDFEKGKGNITLETLNSLCKAIDCCFPMDFLDIPKIEIENCINMYNSGKSEIPSPCFVIKGISVVEENTTEKWNFSHEKDEGIMGSKGLFLRWYYRDSCIIRLYILRCILDSGILDNPELRKKQEFKIEYSFSNNENDDYCEGELYRITSSICSIVSVENEKEVKFGETINKVATCLFMGAMADKNSNSVYVKLSPLAFEKNIKERIKEIIKKIEIGIKKARLYIDQHPFGFPYMCGFRDEKPCFESWIDGDELMGPEIVEAWSEEEAIKKFLERDKENSLYWFYEDRFLRDFAVNLYYYGDFVPFIKKKFKNPRKFSKYTKELFNKYFDENSPTCDIKEEEFVELFVNEANKEELYEMMGKYNFEQYWFECMEINVYVNLDRNTKECLSYLT